MDTKEVLEEALCAYGGTVILVSHDRYLLNRVPNRIVELSGGAANMYGGNYDKYLNILSKNNTSEISRPKAAVKVKKVQKHKVAAKNNKMTEALENEIRELENNAELLQKEMSDPLILDDYVKLSEIYEALKEVNSAISVKYDEWYAVSSKGE